MDNASIHIEENGNPLLEEGQRIAVPGVVGLVDSDPPRGVDGGWPGSGRFRLVANCAAETEKRSEKKEADAAWEWESHGRRNSSPQPPKNLLIGLPCRALIGLEEMIVAWSTAAPVRGFYTGTAGASPRWG